MWHLQSRVCRRGLRRALSLSEAAASSSSNDAGPSRIVQVSPVRRLTTDGRRLVLGIESSCDDSCAALVSAPKDYAEAPGLGHLRATVHNSIVYKQDHGSTQGVQPLDAANGHSSHIPLAIRDALETGQQDGVIKDANLPFEIDAIAVTKGPGMAGCLSQGLSCAKLLSALWNRPLIYTHHMVAHTLTPFMTSEHPDKTSPPLRFPFLVFLLSGGHTQLVLCSSPTKYRILANCSDNSIGNAFDRIARALQVPLDWKTTAPGAALEIFAQGGKAFLTRDKRFALPVPLRGEPAFSYSGLVSQTMRVLENNADIAKSEDLRRAMGYAFQRDAFAQLQDKLRLALLGSPLAPPLCSPDEIGSTPIRDIVVSGGVASNQALRAALQDTLDGIASEQAGSISTPDRYRLHFPPISLCTDNAAMIAHAGLLLWNPTFNLNAKPRRKWPLDDYPGLD